jgi:hypothetical protein
MYKLHLLIEEKKWATALLLLQDPESLPSTKQAHKDSLPLHMACDRKAPDDLILALLRCNQQAAFWPGKNKNLPLHIAANRNLSFEVVEALIRVNPQALECRNANDYTPRDFQVKDNQVFQALNRPTACWVELIEEEAREEDQDENVLQLHKRCDETLRTTDKSVVNFANMVDRLEAVRRKLQDIGRLQSLEIEKNVAEFDTNLIEKISKISAYVTIVEEDAKVASARDIVASAASLSRQSEVEKLIKQTATEFHGLRLQSDVISAAIDAKNASVAAERE